MIRLLVIADDLTGALDTGVQLAKQGAPTLVTLWRERPAAQQCMDPERITVLVADTQSRHVGADEAFRRVEALALAAREAGIPHLYKKTDSTLRGNIGAELAALAHGAGESVLFAPAFPRMRRTTVGGVHYVDGVPLADTDFARDPIDPVGLSDVKEIIARQCPLPVVSCGVDGYKAAVREDPEGPSVFVCDAETQEHLRTLGHVLKKSGRIRCLAGCAGFAEELPAMLELEAVPRRNKLVERGRVLAVCGSVNQRSLDQVNYAAQRGYPVFPLSAEQKLEADYPGSGRCGAFARQVGDAVDRTGAAVVCAAVGRDNFAAAEGDAYQAIAANIGGIAKRILDGADIRTLVVLGGDTLQAVAAAVGGTGFLLMDEPMPGVVEAMMSRGGQAALHVLSKAGGFGGEDALSKILVSLL